MPESFKVLVKELQSLALSVEVLNEDDERVSVADEAGLAEIPISTSTSPVSNGRFKHR